jgi:AraC-like DNA-binding protein
MTTTGNAGPPRGILNPKAAGERFQLGRHLPAPELAGLVEHYWIVRWDLSGLPPHRQETLSHPSMHLVFEPDGAHIYGIVRGRFSRLLEGRDITFGVKFKPAGFHPFAKTPVSTFTDRTIDAATVFGEAATDLYARVRSEADDTAMIQMVERFLCDLLPPRDEHVTLINTIVADIMGHREITKVDDIVSRSGLNKRQLQRLFSQYVGVSPKWIIQRYRLHEAVERLAPGDAVDWAQLAVDLGYFDQAHFIKDFKALVGKSPTAYARSLHEQ